MADLGAQNFAEPAVTRIVYLDSLRGLAALAGLAALLLAVTLLADRPKLSFAAVSAALALGLAALSRRRLLEIKPQTMLGDASLTIYLIHVPHSSPLFWLGYFAAVLAIAWPVNHWY